MNPRFGISRVLPRDSELVYLSYYLSVAVAYFQADEGSLRRSLFEHTGGSYPELITRGDIKLFLPPIGTLLSKCGLMNVSDCI
jgi:hypothetical protein